MPRFVDREQELAELNALLPRPGAQFVLVFGRRRNGKTTLPTPICISAIVSSTPTCT